MANKHTSSLEDLARELNKDSDFRKAYRKQRPYYDLISEVTDCRNRLGLTQEELAKRAGMHQSTISRIESGEHDVKLSTIIQLAEALDARLDIRLVALIDDDDYQKILESSQTIPSIVLGYQDVSEEHSHIINYSVME